MEKWERNVCKEWARLNLLEEAGVRMKLPSHPSGAQAAPQYSVKAPRGPPARPSETSH